MKLPKHILTLVFVFLVGYILTPSLALSGTAPKKVALVIGNSAYEKVVKLPNPTHDATDIGTALARLGFEVTKGLDVDYQTMRLMLRDFSDKAVTADVAIIYYAGHGIEIDKKNYLIPTDARIRTDRDVEFETIRLDTVLATLRPSKGLKIVLLDACRDNPFLALMKRTSASRSIGRGLAQIEPGRGILVGYAAREGTVAYDGDGRNGLYATALLAHLEVPGLELGKLFRKVRDHVVKNSAGQQEPFTYGSLPGEDIFLNPPVKTALVVAMPAPVKVIAKPVPPKKTMPKVQNTAQLAEDFAKAERIGTLSGWKDFITKYGENKSHALVRLALDKQKKIPLEIEDSLNLTDDEMRHIVWMLEQKNEGRTVNWERRASLTYSRRIFIARYTKEIGLPESRYLTRAIANRLLAEKFTPLKATLSSYSKFTRHKEWLTYFHGGKKRCVLATFATDWVGREFYQFPRMLFAAANSKTGTTNKKDNMYFNMVTPNPFIRNRPIHAVVGGRRYTMQSDEGQIKPHSVGKNSVSDDVMKALRKGSSIEFIGTDMFTKKELRITFSASGFTAGFHKIMKECNRPGLINWFR